jgi:hypothetical protein
MTGWSNERPGQEAYKEAHKNIGNYYGTPDRRPYINPAVPMYVPNEGENCIRIVDPIELMQLKVYFFDVHFHRNVGFRKDYFLCLYRHNLGPCAVCENATEDLWQTDKDAAKSFLPDHRRLMWVLDLKKPEESHILKLWSAPRTLSDEILAQSRDPELDIIREVSHPIEGVPIYYMRTGSGMSTKYSGVKLASNPMPLGPEIAEQRFNFMDILIVPTYEEVYASQHMTDLPAEASPELPPTSAYDQDAGSPVDQMGAKDAAAAYQAPQPGTEGEIDYSDLTRIQPENKECFRQYYDQYKECDTCPDRILCAKPWPKKEAKPSKMSKPAPQERMSKPSRPAAGTPPQREEIQRPGTATPPQREEIQRPNNPTQGGSAATTAADNTQKILSAQEKLRQDIANRKKQQG